MPNPGTANNPAGINDFSGPLGEKEPEYGAIAREKALTSAAPVGSPNPDAAGKRSQRRAVRRGGSAATPLPPPPHAGPAVAAAQEQDTFWRAVMADPGASTLARETAQAALGG